MPQHSSKHFIMEVFYRTFSGGLRPSSDDTPRLERWLRCLLTVLIECGLTLVDAGLLLDQKSAAIRQQFAASLHNPLIRAKFEALSSYKPTEFNEQVESVENRLLRFLSSD